MDTFTTPLLGGILIGTAASGMLWLLGRIAGISGIVWSALSQALPDSAAAGCGTEKPGDGVWRWWFVAGLIAGPVLYHSISGAPAPTPSNLAWPWAVAAGLIVGFGTRLGSGCTSGHGVCGLGRLSLRSLAATCTFMATGFATVAVLRHGMGVGL